MIGKIIKEIKWVMGLNESSRTKGVRGAAQYLLDTRGLVVGGGVGGGVGRMLHCNGYSNC